VTFLGCSTKKDGITNRAYHNTTSRYNGFFNAREIVKASNQQLQDSYQEDYTLLLPIFIYGDDISSKAMYPDMDEAIAKSSKVIDRHSMEIEGDERCKWIDDTWFLIGQAQFYKRTFPEATQTFNYTSRQFTEGLPRFRSMIWLLRIYIETEDWEKVERIFSIIKSQESFPPELSEELHAVTADFYIRQGDYTKAIQELEVAIEQTKNKKIKTRRMFILAQLNHKNGDGGKASDLYAEIIERNPPYEMAFYSKINLALSFSGGNSTEVKELLFKMLKDDKNIEFQDQIYYALAEIELKEKNEPKAIEYLKLSAAKSVSNDNVKGLAFLKLGDIYFVKPNYELAQVYYDSTINFLNQHHPDYDAILGKATSLTRLVRDMNVVEREDSLQLWAGYPQDKIDQRIFEIIEALIEAEEEQRAREQREQIQAQEALLNSNDAFSQNIKSGEWYFYNTGAISFGFSEFQKVWGRRKNEDHWRRSDKSTALPELGGFEDEFVSAEDTIEGANDPKNTRYYLKQLPLSDEKLARSHSMIVEAQYDLGLVYKEQMNDIPKAIESFEELLSRYDTCKYEVNTYYQLYLLYKNQGNMAKSDYYKNRVLTRFPDSDYAMIIKNPGFIKSDLAEKEEVLDFYKRTYRYYTAGYYLATIESCEKARALYPNNFMKPQFDFLMAMSNGKEVGEERMVADLNGVVKNHAGTDVAKEAQSILEYLKHRNDPKEESETSEEEEEENVPTVQYKFNMGAQHSFVFIVSDENEDPTLVKTLISDFDRRFFSTSGLKVTSVLLSSNQHMITVKKFGTSIKAMEYYDAFMNNQTFLKEINGENYPTFVISYPNFAAFYENKNIEYYLKFFREKYIKE